MRTILFLAACLAATPAGARTAVIGHLWSPGNDNLIVPPVTLTFELTTHAGTASFAIPNIGHGKNFSGISQQWIVDAITAASYGADWNQWLSLLPTTGTAPAQSTIHFGDRVDVHPFATEGPFDLETIVVRLHHFGEPLPPLYNATWMTVSMIGDDGKPPIPEPTSAVLFVLGAIGLHFLRRRLPHPVDPDFVRRIIP